MFCEWEMADHWLDEGVAEDSMGLFSGPALDEPSDPECLESPRITFFLAELWDYCEEDPATFDEEVRITYIHEFGHYPDSTRPNLRREDCSDPNCAILCGRIFGQGEKEAGR